MNGESGKSENGLFKPVKFDKDCSHTFQPAGDGIETAPYLPQAQ